MANDTTDFYRFIDLTPQAEALLVFLHDTIEVELVEELWFLVQYDKTRRAVQEVVEMPDRLIDLFILYCFQNHGKQSHTKRMDLFRMLREEDVARLEDAIRQFQEPDLHPEAI